MSRRTIQILSTVNVLASATLLIWFRAVSPQSYIGKATQEVVDNANDVDADFRLEMLKANRDAWQYRATQYSYWALVAGLVILINTLVFFWHLLLVRVETDPDEHPPPPVDTNNDQ